jgi:hypothetical protein
MKTVIRILSVALVLAALLFFHQTYQKLKKREAETRAEKGVGISVSPKSTAGDPTAVPAASKGLDPLAAKPEAVERAEAEAKALEPSPSTPGAETKPADGPATAEANKTEAAKPTDAKPELKSVPVVVESKEGLKSVPVKN